MIIKTISQHKKLLVILFWLGGTHNLQAGESDANDSDSLNQFFNNSDSNTENNPTKGNFSDEENNVVYQKNNQYSSNTDQPLTNLGSNSNSSKDDDYDEDDKSDSNINHNEQDSRMSKRVAKDTNKQNNMGRDHEVLTRGENRVFRRTVIVTAVAVPVGGGIAWIKYFQPKKKYLI